MDCFNREDTLSLILNYQNYSRSSCNNSHNCCRLLSTDEFPAYCNHARCPATHLQVRNTGRIPRICRKTNGPSSVLYK